MIALALLLAAATDPVCPTPASWRATMVEGDHPIANVIRAGRGGLSWNYVPITEETLQSYLVRIKHLRPQPRLVVDTASVDCAALARIAAMAARAELPCGDGLCVATTLPATPPVLAPPGPGRRGLSL